MGYRLSTDYRRAELFDTLPTREYPTFTGAQCAARIWHGRMGGRRIDIWENRPTGESDLKVADVSADAYGRRWTTLTGQGSLVL